MSESETEKKEALPEPEAVPEEEEVATESEETVSEETSETEAETEAAETEEKTEEKAEEVEEAPKEPEAEAEGEAGEEEIEVVEEKIYTIPLRHAWVVTPRGKRAPRTVRDVRNYVSRHMKAEEVAMSDEINSVLWSRGINKPPRKVTVRAVKDKEGKVVVYPQKSA